MTKQSDVIDIAAPVDLGMLTSLQQRLAENLNFAELAVAAGIIIGAWFAGFFLGKIIARRLAHFVDGEGDDDVPIKYRSLVEAFSQILRYALAALLIMIAHEYWPWTFLPELLLAIALAFCVAMSVHALLRALKLGFWTSTAACSALFAFIFSSGVGGLTSVSSLLDKAAFTVSDYRLSMLTVVNALLIIIFLIALIRLGNRAITIALTRNPNLDGGQRLLGEKLGMVVLIIAAFFVGIDMLGIDLTAFAVFSGAFGLAIGFGLQKTFGNLIAGIILLMDRSIKPGDVIALGETYGSVNKIGTRAVSIITRDGKEHLIPNENMMTNEVENWSYSSKNIRVRISVGVSYASDMELVQDLLRQSLQDHKRILKRPEPRILMVGFGDSSVDFEVRCWIRDPEDGVTNFQSDIYNRIWNLFKENDIEIPFPQHDINFRNALPPAVKPKATKAPLNKAAVKKAPTPRKMVKKT